MLKLIRTRLFSYLILSILGWSSAASAIGIVSSSTNRLIVKFATPVDQNTLSASPAIAAMDGNQPLNVKTLASGAQVIDFGQHQPIEKMLEVAREVAEEPGVLYAEPDYMMQPMAEPNDPRYRDQWHYFDPQSGINLPAAWELTTGSADVTVAVIDTGIIAHPDLKDNVLKGYDFISDVDVSQDGDGRDANANDPGDFTPRGACGVDKNGNPAPNRDKPSSWHGSHVAGTVAADSNNGVGVAGVSWKSKLLPVRVLGRCGGYTSDITDGMLWAAGISVAGVPDNPTPAKVLNLSLGGRSPCGRTYQDTIRKIRATGATVVVAAGNKNLNAAQFSPASCSGVITVAANKRDGGRSYYSNYGDTVDVAAPGGETFNNFDGVLSTSNSGQKKAVANNYAFYQGTSMAAPHVAGVAALMYAKQPNLTADKVEQILKDTTRPFPSVSTRQCTTQLCGTGIVDAAAALQALSGTDKPNNTLTSGVAVSNLKGARSQLLAFTIEVPAGASQLKVKTFGGTGDADLLVRYNVKPTSKVGADCNSERSNNSEECVVDTPKAGVWHIVLNGYSSFSGVTLLAEVDNESGVVKSFSNNPNLAIPDNDPKGVTSSIDSTYTANVSQATVAVDVTHSYRGDLKIELVTPSGERKVLQANGNDSGKDLKKEYQVSFPSTSAKGQWNLQISDNYRQDTGTLNQWSIRF